MSENKTKEVILKEFDSVCDTVSIINNALQCVVEALNSDLNKCNLCDMAWILSEYTGQVSDKLSEVYDDVKKEFGKSECLSDFVDFFDHKSANHGKEPEQ